MRIALTSDLHIFSTQPKAIVKMFKKLQNEQFDVLVIAGDHSGSFWGYKGSRAIFKIAREHFSGPIVACLGNHDYWFRGTKIHGARFEVGAEYNHPSLAEWQEAYQTIVQHAKDNNIHLLEEDGLFRTPEWPLFVIAGHGLWYKHIPPSKDHWFMPIGVEGDTHRHMYKKSTDALLAQLDGLTDDDMFRFFVSHFPVVEIPDNEDNQKWAGDPYLGDLLVEKGFTKFLNGHTHEDRSGPLRYECGSDNYNPRYKIIQT